VAYVSLYRKYRPQTFADVVGQDHVTRTLVNAIEEERLHHAYLFTGPRGTGKTSTARILAKAINCEAGPTPSPCNTCGSCVSITDGSSVDVIELDMASHGGVDDARELRDRALFAPANSRRKVYILDEVHMASTAAFNALLKLIEEPPAHVLFAMATTDPQKVIPTILSRVQRLDLRRVSASDVGGHVRSVCASEGYTIDDGAVDAVVRAGDGSVRDTLSVLEQVLAFAGTEVTADAVAQVLGLTPADRVVETIERLAERDLAGLLGLVQGLLDQGHDLRRFTLDLVQHLRDLLVLQAAPNRPDLVDATDDRRRLLQAQAPLLASETLLRAVDLLAATVAEQRQGSPRLPLELTLAKLAVPGADGDVAELADRLARLEAGTPLTAGARRSEGAATSGGQRPDDGTAPGARRAEGAATSDAGRSEGDTAGGQDERTAGRVARERRDGGASAEVHLATEPSSATVDARPTDGSSRPAARPGTPDSLREAGTAGRPGAPDSERAAGTADAPGAPAAPPSGAPVSSASPTVPAAPAGPPAVAAAPSPDVAVDELPTSAEASGRRGGRSVAARARARAGTPERAQAAAPAPSSAPDAPADAPPADPPAADERERATVTVSDPETVTSESRPSETTTDTSSGAATGAATDAVTDAATDAATDVATDLPPAVEGDDLAALERLWPGILELVRQRSRRLHAIFEPAVPTALRRGILTLRYAPRYASFHAANAGKGEASDVLRAAIEQAAGTRVRVDVTVEGGDDRRRPIPPSVTPDDARSPVLDDPEDGPSPEEVAEVREAEEAPSGPTGTEDVDALLASELDAELVDEQPPPGSA
jgi:DNA polymerase III subunit gamma/tau